MTERHDGKALRDLRREVHVSPDEVAATAKLTRAEVGDLERGRWTSDRLDREKAIAMYLDAIEKIKNPPPKEEKKSNSGAAKAWATMTLAAGMGYGTRALPESKLKKW